MIKRERVRVLNGKEIKKGRYALYWMQASQRAEYNHALEYSILKANELNQQVVVFFGITDDFPEGNERHYYFMLEGLREKCYLRERCMATCGCTGARKSLNGAEPPRRLFV